MRSTFFYLGLAVLCGFMCGIASAKDQTWTVASPDGKVAVTLGLMDSPDAEAYKADKAKLYYRVDCGEGKARKEVLEWSPLGLVLADQNFADNLVFKSESQAAVIDEKYTLLHGKRTDCRNVFVEKTYSFVNAEGAALELVLRAANDGVAFRYRLPGKTDVPAVLNHEETGFRMTEKTTAWMTAAMDPGQFAPGYEEYYPEVKPGTSSPKKEGWTFPALLRAGENGPWALITEAAVDETFCGSRMEKEAPNRVYRLRLPAKAEGWGVGEVQPRHKLPWMTPWRVVIVGESLGTVVESTLVTDLNPPSRIQDTSWIKPGRVAWSWWSDHDSPTDFKKQKDFIDLAAEMTWEYALVDANWTFMNGGDVRQLADYAKSKNVGLLLWYNSGGDHNVVPERPRGAMNLPEPRIDEMKLLARWGIKGIKVDFFQSDKQNIMGVYQGILRDAAQQKIMVNFHGCTLPRGWDRTWPNLMTMEAVRGAESYTFAPEYPAKAPQLNVTLPYTRNVVGPMDYTPCTFTDAAYPHITTSGHELALTVAFESGWLHLADRSSAYRGLPEEPKNFLKTVPVVWDATKFIKGTPGRDFVVARRRGTEWRVAVLNGEKEAKTVSVPLSFLGPVEFEATVITDGEKPREFASRKLNVKSSDSIEMKTLPYGGGVIQLKAKM